MTSQGMGKLLKDGHDQLVHPSRVKAVSLRIEKHIMTNHNKGGLYTKIDWKLTVMEQELDRRVIRR